VWRNTPGARAFAAMWGERMSNNSLHEQGIDDQISFNQLMASELREGGGLRPKAFPLRQVDGNDRVMYAAPGDAVRLMVLPTVAFAGAAAPQLPMLCQGPLTPVGPATLRCQQPPSPSPNGLPHSVHLTGLIATDPRTCCPGLPTHRRCQGHHSPNAAVAKRHFTLRRRSHGVPPPCVCML
jgi:hypothetical protein